MAPRQLSISSIDWLVIIAATIIALLLFDVNPDFHTFCILDMTISYPYRSPKVSLLLFIILSIIVPLLVISSVSIFTPLPSRSSNLLASQTRAQKLRNLNASLLGIGVSLATSTVIFTGLKNLTGKPRPNLLSLCDPDLENIEKFTVAGFGATFDRLWVMVDVEVCRQADKVALRDGFRSFPSGYATRLWYLSLFLCHKFRVVIPYPSVQQLRNLEEDLHHPLNVGEENEEPGSQIPAQSQREYTTFPAYLLLLPYIPLGLAIFIAGTRYFDFRNHGFDVLAGAAIGSTTAWLGSRMYHSSLYMDLGESLG